MRSLGLCHVAACLLAALRAAATDEAGTAFLEENAKKEGVVVLESGLQYKVLRAATNASAPRPQASDPCTCHYEGTLVDGTVFDSSRKRGSPATFAPNQVIKGWTEALMMMREGDHWQLFIPSELAYGDSGRGGKITPGAALIFDLELIKVGEEAGGIRAFLMKPIAGPIMGWHLLLLVGVVGFNMIKGGGGGDGRKVSASHILVKSEETCKELKAQLDAEKDVEKMKALFKDLASKHSDCPSGKQAGGSLGEFGPGQMVPAFDKVCWSSAVGEVVGPVQTNFGYHLVLVTDRKLPEEKEKDKDKDKNKSE